MSANVLRKMSGSAPVWLIKFLGNIWPPFFGAGIYVEEASKDFTYIKTVLKKRWYNSNYVGTQFGGSIYAMTDPFYMLLIMNNLGRDYIVWDKAAKVDFIKPGTSDLSAEFRINKEQIELIKLKTRDHEKYIFDLPVEIFDEKGEKVAEVIKTLYVRKKN